MDDHPAAHSAHLPTQASINRTAFANHCEPHTVTLVMTNGDIDGFMDLHETVTAQTPFVKTRTKDSIRKHLAAGHFAIAVYSAQGQMIAQALMALPDIEGTSNLNGYPLKGKLSPATSAVIQSVGIHPDHKKCGLPTVLFAAAASIAQGAGRKHIVAKLNVENRRGFNAFFKEGYRQHDVSVVVPGEDYRSIFMVQDVNPLTRAFVMKGQHP